MASPQTMRLQPIFDMAELCARKGIKNAVLSPGSRCAPLTLAFAQHPNIQTYAIPDERCAGFMALGLSQQSRNITVLICTSGSAVYNLAPAIVEAYFQQVPLLVLTADRPAEWIAQNDGQTIHQNGIFGSHVKQSFQVAQDYSHEDDRWGINRMINDAINLAQEGPKGPVHVNIPLREPLYPSPNEPIGYSPVVRVIHPYPIQPGGHADWMPDLEKAFSRYQRILVVAGQGEMEEPLLQHLSSVQKKHSIPFIADITANLHPLEGLVRHSDLFLGQAPLEVIQHLKPDLLITFGQSLVSKNLKNFIRKHPPESHWHIQLTGAVADTFKTLTHIVRTSPLLFFETLASFPVRQGSGLHNSTSFLQMWKTENLRVDHLLNTFFSNGNPSEFGLVHEVLKNLPIGSTLHLANSMSVRYANFIGLPLSSPTVQICANRGVSGIDGCVSTALGYSLNHTKPTVLITGDIAFFYDRNAFWHSYPIPNLRIILLNNHGGAIFNMIDGPSSLPDFHEYFVGRQPLNAKNLCEEFGIGHLKWDHRKDIKTLFKDFFELDGKPKVLEIETTPGSSKDLFEMFKKIIKESYGQ